MFKHPKRIMGFLALFVVVGLFVAGVFFPFLLKRYIERNSEAWIGRRITIGSIVLNPFSGVYAVHAFTCFEPGGGKVFVSFDKLGIKGSVVEGLISGHWHFRDAELRAPYVRIAQDADHFNFSDLLEMSTGPTDDDAQESPGTAVFTVSGVALTDGRIDYVSDLLREPVQVVDLHLKCDLLSSADARMVFDLGFGLPDGTRLDGGFVVDTDSARYAVDARLRSLDLSTSLPYLQDFFSAGRLEGKVDVDLLVRQRYSDGGELALSSRIAVHDLLLQDDRNEQLLSLKRLEARMDTLDGDHFEVGLVEIDGLSARFALLADGSDNWTRLLDLVPDSTSEGEGAMVLDASESNYFVLLAEYIGFLGSAMTGSQYTASSLVLTDGRLVFEDHTMPRSFVYDISAIDVRANRFNESSPVAPVTASARLNDVGPVNARAEFDPKDFRNVVLELQVDSLMLAHLDPYTRWYAAHPTADGLLSYTSHTVIRDGVVDSRNSLHVDRLSFGRPVNEHYPDIYLLPLRLATGLLKDAKGQVALELPVKGDLRDPQFRVWPIVWQILKNLVVKAAMAPARLIAGLFDGADEKDLEQVRFAELQVRPGKPQLRVLDLLAKALAAKPQLRVDLVPVVDSLVEAGELALFKAKARYLFQEQAVLTTEDSVRVLGLALKDSSLVRWMDFQVPGTSDLPMTRRATQLIGQEAVLRAWRELEQARREEVIKALQTKGVDAGRIRFRAGTAADVAPFKGQPGYRFIYGVLD